jgi:hypothetical protein
VNQGVKTSVTIANAELVSFKTESLGVAELRQFPRMPMKRAKGQLKKQALLANYTVVTILDVSRSGVGVLAAKRFVLGERVKLKIGYKVIIGTVVYSFQLLGKRECRMGIEFESMLTMSDMLSMGASGKYAFS